MNKRSATYFATLLVLAGASACASGADGVIDGEGEISASSNAIGLDFGWIDQGYAEREISLNGYSKAKVYADIRVRTPEYKLAPAELTGTLDWNYGFEVTGVVPDKVDLTTSITMYAQGASMSLSFSDKAAFGLNFNKIGDALYEGSETFQGSDTVRQEFRGYGTDFTLEVLGFTVEKFAMIEKIEMKTRANIRVGAVNYTIDAKSETFPATHDLTSIFTKPNERCIPEDVNGDSMVDIIDLVTVAAYFGDRNVQGPYDVDKNGRVDILDLSRVASAYRAVSCTR